MHNTSPPTPIDHTQAAASDKTNQRRHELRDVKQSTRIEISKNPWVDMKKKKTHNTYFNKVERIKYD